ncbi:MAG: lipoyl synthase [Elusimicrobiota bacterium]
MSRPAWLNKKINPGRLVKTSKALAGRETVCRRARCPNIGECFSRGVATLLILGKTCTRNCLFCCMEKGIPQAPDPSEPAAVEKTLRRLNIKHAVLTSPTRDDLSDGGAEHFAICARHASKAASTVELLIPDFQGEGLKKTALSSAEIIGHNMETVERLYFIRPGASYRRSLKVLTMLKKIRPDLKTKSALMLGLGEKEEEIIKTISHIRSTGCSYLSLGQYLKSSRSGYPVQEYIHPNKFDFYKTRALAMGFEYVRSGPYVRSSYMADSYV